MNQVVCDHALLKIAADNIEDAIFVLAHKTPADLPPGLTDSEDPAMLGLMAERALRGALQANEWMEKAEESGLFPVSPELVQQSMEKLDSWTKQIASEGALSAEAEAIGVIGREMARLRLLCIRLRMENNWLKMHSQLVSTDDQIKGSRP